jgi:riboflavin transporter FmnP
MYELLTYAPFNIKEGLAFSAKHAALIRKSKDWLARNQDNVSKWDDKDNL